MPEEKPELEIPKALIDWSRWLIAINFSAATGCVLVLLDKDKAALTGANLVYAVIFFALTVFCSVLYTYLLSTEIKAPFRLKWHHHFLGALQILFFAIAFIFFYLWVTRVENIHKKPAAQMRYVPSSVCLKKTAAA
ncbi:MAG: hypothetical protein INR73_06450 [Williamsia sp.]|nr:hypothetical protein [Williamsia sp.]